MSLESVPEALLNTTNEHCFESCLGMTLAHYKKLGNLGLEDIVAAVSRPGEEFTPMARTFEWLNNFGLQVEYIEKEDENNTDFLTSLREAGTIIRPVSPTTAIAIQLANEGKALISQVSYEGGEPDHAIFLAEDDDTGVLLLDPNGMEFGTSSLEGIWGRYPNLISVDKK